MRDTPILEDLSSNTDEIGRLEPVEIAQPILRTN